MLVRAGNTWLWTAHAALLAGVLTGCSEAAEGDDSQASARPSASASADTSGAGDSAAPRGGTIGAAGSACELPVVFDTAKSWKAEAVEAPLGQGPRLPGVRDRREARGQHRLPAGVRREAR